MKTLLVDIDDKMLAHCVTRIGVRQELLAATSKAEALIALRNNPAVDVVIACERLADGSGLALLDELHLKYPNLIRVFCTERQRLTLVRSRLAAFRLKHTITYPLKPAKLELFLVKLAHIRHAKTIPMRPRHGRGA